MLLPQPCPKYPVNGGATGGEAMRPDAAVQPSPSVPVIALTVSVQAAVCANGTIQTLATQRCRRHRVRHQQRFCTLSSIMNEPYGPAAHAETQPQGGLTVRSRCRGCCPPMTGPGQPRPHWFPGPWPPRLTAAPRRDRTAAPAHHDRVVSGWTPPHRPVVEGPTLTANLLLNAGTRGPGINRERRI